MNIVCRDLHVCGPEMVVFCQTGAGPPVTGLTTGVNAWKIGNCSDKNI